MHFLMKQTVRQKISRVMFIVILLPLLFFPAPQKANAQWAVFDVPLTVRAVLSYIQNGLILAANLAIQVAQIAIQQKELVADPLAYLAAERLRQSVVNEIISRTRNLDGAPAFVRNLESNLLQLDDSVASNFGSEILSLQGTSNSACNFGSFSQSSYCIQLANKVKLSTRQNYENKFAAQSKNTIGDYVPSGNADDYYADFTQGGWAAFLSQNTELQNNPYSNAIRVEAEAKSRATFANDNRRQELVQSRGFRSKKKCTSSNPAKCLVETPGAVIESQLNFGLNSSLRRLEGADEISEIITNAVASQIQQVIGKLF